MPSSDLARELDAMARDFAAVVHGGRDSSDRRVGMAQEGSGLFARQPVVASVREFPRPPGPADISDRYRSNQSASDKPRIGRLTSRNPAGLFKTALPMVMNSLQRLRPASGFDIPLRTIATVCLVTLIGVGAIFAWQSRGISMTNSPDITTGQAVATRAGQVSAGAPQPAPVTQTEPAPAATATSPELVLQLETMARDLAVLRDSVEQLTAKQEQTTQTVARLQAVVAKQEQTTQTLQEVAAKQEQMAQNIAMLQAAAEEGLGQKLSTPASSQAVPLPRPKKALIVAPTQSPAQSASASSSSQAVPLPRPKKALIVAPTQSAAQSASASSLAPVPFFDASP